MYEADLSNMSRDRLIQTLAAVRNQHQRRAWDVEEAQLVAEIRSELIRRGLAADAVDRIMGVSDGRIECRSF